MQRRASNTDPTTEPRPNRLEEEHSSLQSALRARLGIAPPGGQGVLPGIAGAQLGLDGGAYEPAAGPSREAASRYLGPHTEFCTAPDAGLPTEEPAARPLPGQLPLFESDLDEAKQLDMWSRLEVATGLLRGDCTCGARDRGAGPVHGKHRPTCPGRFDRQAKCHRTRRIGRDESVKLRRFSSGTWSIDGLVQCGHWTCPHCGPRRARETSSSLALIFARHQAAALWHDIWMLTLSLPHRASDDPEGVLAALYAASEGFWRSRGWRRFAARWGIAIRVRVLDATHGGPNGSHPHFHIAILPTLAAIPTYRVAGALEMAPVDAVSAELARMLGARSELLPLAPLAGADKATREQFLDELRGGLLPAWETAVRAAGWDIPDPTAFRQHAIKLSAAERASSYFMKWGLADEIGAPTAKSRTHLRLLDAVASGCDAAGDAFRAWRRATDGRAWVTGLELARQRYNVTDEDCAAYLEELRRRRKLEAEREGTPLVEVAPLALEIRPHLYAGALNAGWREVFATVDEAAAAGRDPQQSLDEYLWRMRRAPMRSHDSTAPPDT